MSEPSWQGISAHPANESEQHQHEGLLVSKMHGTPAYPLKGALHLHTNLWALVVPSRQRGVSKTTPHPPRPISTPGHALTKCEHMKLFILNCPCVITQKQCRQIMFSWWWWKGLRVSHTLCSMWRLGGWNLNPKCALSTLGTQHANALTQRRWFAALHQQWWLQTQRFVATMFFAKAWRAQGWMVANAPTFAEVELPPHEHCEHAFWHWPPQIHNNEHCSWSISNDEKKAWNNTICKKQCKPL